MTEYSHATYRILIFDFLQLFSEAGKVTNVTIAKKKDSRNKGTIN